MGTSARGTTTGAVLLGLCVGLTGCGEGVAGSAPVESDTRPLVVDGLVREGYEGSFELTALVVQGDTGGPAACIGAQTLEGRPPGARPCGGLDLNGWDWEAVPHTEQADGVRRGTYRITGTVDMSERSMTMTMTAPALVAEIPPVLEEERDYSTRCPEPAGGWAAPDPSRATSETELALSELAPQLEGYAGLFVDLTWATNSGDPSTTVYNVLTVGDVAATEAALREVWGGPLCVSPGIRSEAEVRAPEDAMIALDGFMGGGADMFTGRFEADVLIARSEDQAAFDAEFGEGVVHLTGLLTPVG